MALKPTPPEEPNVKAKTETTPEAVVLTVAPGIYVEAGETLSGPYLTEADAAEFIRCHVPDGKVVTIEG